MNFFWGKQLRRFVLRTTLFIPLAFYAWYMLGPYLNIPIAVGVEWSLALIRPGVLAEATVNGRSLSLLTNLSVHLEDGRQAVLRLPSNPLIYSWNLPLLFALTLGVPERSKLVYRLAIAYVALLPAHVWGVVFQFLLNVTIQAQPEIAAQVGLGDFGKTLVAIGYQFGYLMFPVISATFLWIALHKKFIRSLAPEARITP
jgi:hypothetical protein